MTKYEFRFHEMNSAKLDTLQAKLDTSKAEEITSMENYIKQLEEGINDWATKYAELEKQYQEDVPVANAEVGYMSHIGAVVEDEHEPLDDEFKQTQNGYKQPIGFKQNICTN